MMEGMQEVVWMPVERLELYEDELRAIITEGWCVRKDPEADEVAVGLLFREVLAELGPRGEELTDLLKHLRGWGT